MELPETFLAFLRENGVDPSVFSRPPSRRYVRIDPRKPPELREFQSELQKLNPSAEVEVREVEWMRGFWAVGASVKIASSRAYKSGQIYGMDVSSAVPVDLLCISLGEHVLDLCCAPGAKLLYVAEKLQHTGSVTGVDISAERLQTCRNLLEKYGYTARLYCADGRSFAIPAAGGGLYDKVMVDAECTHEGSIKHIEKFSSQWGWDSFQSRVVDTHSDLEALQRALALTGVRLLRPGGLMTYSTCSFARKQNEGVVSWLLATCAEVELCEIARGRYPGTQGELGLRLDPCSSDTGGQFVALLRKRIDN